MDSAIIDTGVWLAIFDARDERHREGQAKAELLDMLRVVIPWPTMYETLRTRFVRNKAALGRFETFLKSPAVVYLEDELYRDAALQMSLDSSLRRNHPLSMVDCLIRLLIDDINVKVQFLATFNDRDFIDVCAPRGVEII
ncbi:MAG TPA: PIN domain-containing protein [Pirellulales bacterium]|jgi:predicted nucleic acid-binding protein|nr:PIN domain-containing protein [Pirellulales bacterium]